VENECLYFECKTVVNVRKKNTIGGVRETDKNEAEKATPENVNKH